MGKNQDPGSGINIPDPPHCIFVSVADPDPGSGVFLTPGSGSGMYRYILDHISDSLEIIFRVKIFLDADPESGNLFDPGSGMKNIGIRDKLPVSATLIFVIFLTIFIC
jgi:hypothetical protein